MFVLGNLSVSFVGKLENKMLNINKTINIFSLSSGEFKFNNA